MRFAEKQADWIRREQQKYQKEAMYEDQKIGKLHRLHFVRVQKGTPVSSRVTATKIIIQMHPHESQADEDVQARAHAAALRGLRKETLQLLTPRLHSIAERHNFEFQSVQAKELKRRWGSCDSNKHIVLNLYLVQLSWEQIDYVLCHELTHTEHMNHSVLFWSRLEQVLPNARSIAKAVRHMQPHLLASENATALYDDMAY